MFAKERLVESIHRFSKHPIIVVNFGHEALDWDDNESLRNSYLVLCLHERGFVLIDSRSIYIYYIAVFEFLFWGSQTFL